MNRRRLTMSAVSVAAVGLLATVTIGSANAATIYSLPDASATVSTGQTLDKEVLGSSFLDGHLVSAVQLRDNTTSQYGLYYGYDVRRQANGDEYLTRLITGPDNSIDVNLAVIHDGVTTPIVSKPTGVAYVAGQNIIFDTLISGTAAVQIQERAYLAGTTKPAYQLNYTDASPGRISSAGLVGVIAYTSSSSAAQSFAYSKFQAIVHSSAVAATSTTMANPTVTTVKTTPTTVKPVTTTTTKPTTTTTAKPATVAAVGDINSVLGSGSSSVSLGSGIYSFSDFSFHNSGVNIGTHGLVGAGSAKTIIAMKANSSTKASLVPAQGSGQTNPLYLMQSLSATNLVLSGFTLQGSTQGHLYGGLFVGRTTGAKISDIKVVDAPGNAASPPGETFGVGDYQTVNATYSNIEVDGKNQGAAAFGTNGSTNVTVNGLYSHDSPYSAGITYWETKGGTLNDFKVNNTNKGINMEQNTGTFVFNRPTFGSNKEGVDLSTFSTLGSVKVTINDPVLAAGQKIRIQPFTGASAYGGKNVQVKSDIRVTVSGVDKTSSLVTWLS